jgi:integrase/recombinase XerD
MPDERPDGNDQSHDRQADIRRVAKILREGGYSYDQSAHLFKEARREVGLSPPDRSGQGSPERLTSEELEDFLAEAYDHSGRRGLMMRTLFETGTRVGTFVQIDASDVAFRDLEIRVVGKGEKPRDVPILSSLANELRLHLGERRTGPLFRSRQGGRYSKRRIQQIVRETAREAGITKRVYPHLLRHTVAQHLSDRGMPEELLQSFLGHERPETTQVYYKPARRRVKQSFEEAMTGESS